MPKYANNIKNALKDKNY